jgi:integrase
MFSKGENMARKRGQREGYLYKKGPSWILRWREDVKTASGQLQRGRFSRTIGPASGPDKLTRKEAERQAWSEVLEKLDNVTIHPQSLATVKQFVSAKFEPEWIWTLKPAGKKHYGMMLRHVLPAIGDLRLCQVTSERIQQLVKAEIEKGNSVQTARHVRNTVSAIFRHAKASGFIHGDNPAQSVRLPAMSRKPVYALAPDQAKAVFSALPEPVRTMAFVSMVTSLNVAELLALRWKYVNLSAQFVIVQAEAIPPHTLAVRENYYRGDFCSLKKEARKRNVPLPVGVVELLSELRRRPRFTAPDDLVFANRKGAPLNEGNIRNRILKPIGKAVGLPFQLSWHAFRRTAATLAEVVDMPLSDRQAVMGHAGGEMTLRYTSSDTERRRAGIQSMSELIVRRAKQ